MVFQGRPHASYSYRVTRAGGGGDRRDLPGHVPAQDRQAAFAVNELHRVARGVIGNELRGAVHGLDLRGAAVLVEAVR